MSGYDVEDEYDVAQGIIDALSLPLKSPDGMTGALWLGWNIEDPSLGEFEIEASGKRFRVTVEPIEPDAE